MIMRMWGLTPNLMCMRHIVGEHGEFHKHRHSFVKKHNLKGRFIPLVQIDPKNMKKRHDELSRYLKNHKSPYEMPDISHLSDFEGFKIDLSYNLLDLYMRCEKCRKKINKYVESFIKSNFIVGKKTETFIYK